MGTLPPPISTEPRRIVVRGVNWLGDAVMTTPALFRLRERFPAASIQLLTHEKLAGLWTGHPAVDGVIPFTSNDGVFRSARRLRAGRYDLAVLLPNSHRAALEAFLAGIPRRLGTSRRWRDWLLTDTVEVPPGIVSLRKRQPAEIRALLGRETLPGDRSDLPARPGPESHHIHLYLRLVAALGANPAPVTPRLDVTSAEVEKVRQRWNLDPSIRWIGINPGAEYGPAKRWPVDRFLASARRLATSSNRGFVLFGGTSDRRLAESIATGIGTVAPVRILAGETSLRELCAGLSACAVLLTNDTGPMHVAAAVGTPVVVLFGSTSPALTGPGLPGDPHHHLLRSNAACAPCFLRECPVDFRCMTGHSVENVAAAVSEVLSRRSPTHTMGGPLQS